MKETEIATILNITPQTVSNTVNSSLGQQKLAEMRDKRDEVVIKYDPLAEVKKLLPTAINIYKEIMESASASLSIKKSTADTIVKDICGYEAPKKIDGRFVSANITPYLDELKQRGREAARQCGMLYDGRDDNEEVKEIEETKDV
jgi:predicted transcriptional regulator